MDKESGANIVEGEMKAKKVRHEEHVTIVVMRGKHDGWRCRSSGRVHFACIPTPVPSAVGQASVLACLRRVFEV